MTRTRSALLAAAVGAVLVAAPLAGPTPSAQAQQGDDPAVLVYSHTAGFRHLSIPDGITAIQELGAEHGFTVVASEDPAVFTDDSLAEFDAVVFLLTTGSVMTDPGRAAFERYVRDGGGYVGVHSAADTEYEWDFYEQILGGAYFLSHPVQQPGVIVNEAPDEPSTSHLPEEWAIPFEEFYSFRASPRDRVRVLLSIDESTYQQDPNTSSLPSEPEFPPTFPEGQSGVMGDHPMSWCHDIDEGRVWYTALGHEGYLYRLPEYRQHLLGGLQTAMRLVEADCSVEAASTPAPTPAPTAPSEPADPTPPPTQDDAPAAAGNAPLPATGGASLVALAALTSLGLGALARRRG